MTVLQKLAALSEITPRKVREVLTYNDFLFEILERQKSEVDYDALLSIYQQVDEILANQDYNIFHERVVLKAMFLSLSYNLPVDFVTGLLCVEPMVKLDILLEELLKEIPMFDYIKKGFKEYKENNGIALSTISKYLNKLELDKQSDSLKEALEQLSKTTGINL